MTYNDFLVEQADQIATITLNNPASQLSMALLSGVAGAYSDRRFSLCDPRGTSLVPGS